MRTHYIALVIAATAVAVWASTPVEQGTELKVAGRKSTAPSIAARGPIVTVVWGASAADGTDVYAATSRNGGLTFGPLVRVNDDRTSAKLSGEQPPRVVITAAATTVVWTSRSPSGTVLVSARSTNGGASFSTPAVMRATGATGNRGWESIAADQKGGVVALWLDHRDVPAMPGGHDHSHGTGSSTSLEARAPKRDGVAQAQLSKLFFARMDGKVSPMSLTGGVCYCCKTAVAASGMDKIYAAWRHVYPGNMRDIAFTMSRDGGRTFAAPVRVSEDQWSIDGCPENGPSMAIDGGGRIHVVWPTVIPASQSGADGTPALFYAISTDGKAFTPRRRLPTEGVPRHPQIAVDKAGLVAAWDEVSNGAHRIAIARSAVGETGAPFVRQRLEGDAAGDYPAVTVSDGIAVVAWVARGQGAGAVRVRRLGN